MMLADNNSTSCPKVSFVIPTLNSSRTLERCLQSVIMQNYPDIEIILVDGHSSDESVNIAKQYTHRIYYCPGPLSECRMVGFEKSSGEIVGVFDSDVIFPHSLWLQRAVKVFDGGKKIAAVWPVQIPVPGASAISRCFINHQWAIIAHRAKRGKGLLGGGNALVIKRFIQEVGGYDKRLDFFEDFYLARRLREKRYAVCLYNDPIYHDTHISWYEIIRKDLRRFRVLGDRGVRNLMGLSGSDMLYQYCALSIYLTLRGLLVDREFSWLLLPFLTLMRALLFTFSCMV